MRCGSSSTVPTHANENGIYLMKLIRFGEPGKERPGLIMEDATRLDVSEFVRDYDEAFFANDGLSRLKRLVEGERLFRAARCAVCPLGITRYPAPARSSVSA